MLTFVVDAGEDDVFGVTRARLITEVQGMPKKLSKVAGTQQIDREWLQLKKFLFSNLHRKCKKTGGSDVNPRLKQRVWQYMHRRGLTGKDLKETLQSFAKLAGAR